VFWVVTFFWGKGKTPSSQSSSGQMNLWS